MKKGIRVCNMIPIYMFALFAMLSIAYFASNTISVFSESTPIKNRTCVIIDAGHGGVDGGATSCSGVLESKINLQIALRLEDIMHLLGYKTVMIRTTDRSIHTQGDSIAQKKISDLKERVRIVNEAENCTLISIHQNYFSNGKYFGPQVFYAGDTESRAFADMMQNALNTALCPQSNRTKKPANGIYLMEHIHNVGILIECGFLSNPQEESKLLNTKYQKELCCVIGATYCKFQHGTMFA